MRFLSVVVVFFGLIAAVQADEPAAPASFASPERVQAATGHYARAQKLLLEAMKEFDAGRKIARPDLVVNPEQWRGSVSAKADELSRLVSPQSRETAGGNRYRESSALLNQGYLKKKPPVQVQKAVVTPVKSETLARAKFEDRAVPPSEAQVLKNTTTEPAMPAPRSESVTAPLLPVEQVMGAARSPDLARKTAATEEPSQPGVKSDSQTVDGNLEAAREVPDIVGDEEIKARLKKLSEEIAQEEQVVD
jgi:hypothetical protein